jgi:sugar phosphate isomerase/epimerase
VNGQHGARHAAQEDSRMHPRICINGLSTREWTLDQDIAYYRSIGAKAVTVSYSKLHSNPNAGVEAILHADFQPALLGGGSATPLCGGLQILKAPIDAASAMKCPIFYSISGGTPERMPTDVAYEKLVEALIPVNSYARSKGVQLAIENNSIATRGHGFIHTLADAADLAWDADMGICLELQNCWYERRLRELFRAHVKRFVMIQVSDFMVGEELRLNRRVPGDGSIPLEWMLEQLLVAGYGGFFDIEILGPSIEAEGYESALARSVEWLSERLVRWGV